MTHALRSKKTNIIILRVGNLFTWRHNCFVSVTETGFSNNHDNHFMIYVHPPLCVLFHVSFVTFNFCLKTSSTLKHTQRIIKKIKCLKYCPTISMVVLVVELKINFLNFGTKVYYGFFLSKVKKKKHSY